MRELYNPAETGAGMTSELFDKYIQGLCAPAEKQQVEQWLKQEAHAEFLDQLMAERWQQSHGIMPEDETRLLWQALQRKVTVPRKVVHMHWYRAIAAAAAVVVALSGTLLWQQRKAATGAGNMALYNDTLHTPGQQWVHVSNRNNYSRKISLEDGSVAELYAHSSLEYVKGFEPARRTILLTGTATFTVAKDRQRPLSVYSGDMVTTALGTCFTVTGNGAGVTVRLHEGKVAVRAIHAKPGEPVTYLLPGQECRYLHQQHTMAVTQIAGDKLPATKGAAAAAEVAIQDTLVFNNTPLVQVLQTLQQYYHTPLQYKAKDMAAIAFSGTISRADSLPMVLQVIANMNALQVSRGANGYHIGK